VLNLLTLGVWNSAASARLLFMKRWPNAFNTESFKTHIEAAEHNLNSVKNALEERQRQRERKKLPTGFLVSASRRG
jgi:hypothetical protein